MSYQVLARKWRPATFDQMVGQSHVLQALTNALSQQRLHHAYLFTGTRGVGKTSLARLFAKGLNCEQGVTATPCGVCGSCVEIAQGRFVDLIEVDAASRTKVDDTRELLDNVQYRPTRGRFKVYLIDEVHMLSRSSFNALLKTLEEPPEHVKFLLATTDPQKLPVTVLSRCLQFNLKSLTQTEIATQLNHILTQEQFPFESEALTLLAKAANGSMRDALSLTDQAIAFGGGNVMLTQVQTMLGSIDEQHVVALLKALTDADIGALMHTCAQVLAYGADAQEVLRSLLELLHQITLTQFAPVCAQQSLYSTQISAFAEQLTPEQVQLYYQILLTGRKDLPHAPDPKSGLEMALLRAVAFVPEKPVKRWQPDIVAEVILPEGNTSVAPQTVAQEQPTAEKKTALIEQAAASLQAETSLEIASAESPLAVTPKGADAVRSAQEMVIGDANDELEPAALEVDAALIAEQAVILSQAQSLGFNVDGANIKAEPHALSSALSASAPAHELSVSTTISAAGIEDNGTEHSSSLIMDYAQESAPLDSYQDAYAGFSSGSYNDDVFNHSFEPQAEHDEVQHAESAQNTAYIQTAVGVQGSVDHQLAAVAQESTLTEIPANVPLADDDILSAVLAARDSLLSDLDALSAKDGDEKKSPLDSKLKAPNSKTTITLPKLGASRASTTLSVTPAIDLETALTPDLALGLNADVDLAHSLDFDDEFDLDLKPIAEHQAAPSMASSSGLVAAEPVKATAGYDRPPWEAAPETDNPTTQVDSIYVDSADTKTVDINSVDINSAAMNSVQTDYAQTSLDTTHLINDVSNNVRDVSAGQHIEQPLETTPTSAMLQAQTQTKKHQGESQAPVPAVTPMSTATLAHTSHAVEGALNTTSPISGHPLDLHWYKLMASLDIGGRVRQLAVNSVYQVQSDPLLLLLKPNQKHLAADGAIVQLEQALSAVLGNPRRVQVVIGIDAQRETPLELRKRFHQELLQQAHQSLLHDDNVQWLIQRMGAELDADSLVYPPELLNLRSQQIQALPELTEVAS
ncbi:DNA polymerase III subunit gamma/tau [Shewanella morhuae]|uniref:DNA polymerase III subunit gamma/tau n=1 Tax=Shewanella morhuae TaxID=365591 RepID=UPI001BC2270C|nr:DNA polymerase III subunit gamma/tau [Shewanella morhuae]GIU14117.1 DNA polymerase III subunit gamma/tau [Shewanella morhuae]